MSQHDRTASEQDAQDDELHAAVSSAGMGPVGAAAEMGIEFISEGFLGMGGGGELEVVTGFDPTRALSEGISGETVAVTEALKAIPGCCPEEFEKPEDVCGADDRAQICPATAIPWKWLCQLIITAQNGSQWRCTGWLIGPHTVMTAGHCVFMHAQGGWVRQIEVIPGMCAESRPFGSQIATSFHSVKGWTESKDWNYDYGSIILPNNDLGNWVGWFGFAVLPDSALQGLLANNSGYPADKPFGTQWFNAGSVTNVADRKFYYMIDTYGGQSGSPVWRLYQGQRHAIGVHAYGGCPNSATRITKPVFDNMIAWKR